MIIDLPTLSFSQSPLASIKERVTSTLYPLQGMKTSSSGGSWNFTDGLPEL
jgi:hypothetical protein